MRVERAVEAFVAHVAATDQRLDLAVPGAGDHDRAFERRRALARGVEARQARHQRALRGALHVRIERGEDFQALGTQVGLVVVLPQLPAHEIQKRRVRRGAHAGLLGHAERRGLGAQKLLGVDVTELAHLGQYQIAAFERALRMTVRVVQRRSLDHPYQ